MIVRDLSSALPSLFAALLDATNDLDKSAGAGAAMAIQVMVNGSVKHAQQDVKFVVSALVRNILSCLERTRSCLERAEDAFSTARRKVATATRQKKGPTRMSLIDMRGKRVCLEALQCMCLLCLSMNALSYIATHICFQNFYYTHTHNSFSQKVHKQLCSIPFGFWQVQLLQVILQNRVLSLLVMSCLNS